MVLHISRFPVDMAESATPNCFFKELKLSSKWLYMSSKENRSITSVLQGALISSFL